MSTFVDIGNMVAKYDTKTGVIRLSSTEKGNPLRESGTVINVYPGNPRYDILRDMIEDSSDKPLDETENKLPHIVHISNKYRSNDPTLVPLGVNSDRTPVHWDIRKHKHLVAVGSPGSGKSETAIVILDHVKTHKKNKRAIIYNPFINEDTEDNRRAFNHWDENIESYGIKENYAFVDKVSKILKGRTSYLAENNLDNLDQQIASGEFDEMFVIIDGYNMSSYEENDAIISDFKHLREDILDKGGSVGMHLMFCSQDDRVEKLTSRVPLNLNFSTLNDRKRLGSADYVDKSTGNKELIQMFLKM